MTESGREMSVETHKSALKTASAHVSTHLVIYDFFSQARCHHLLQRLLFALCLSCQLCRAVTKPCNVILEEQQRDTLSQNKHKSCSKLNRMSNENRAFHLTSFFVERKCFIYLHMCYLVLFPIEALHLVLFQLQPSLYILVIVTLKAKIDSHGRAEGWHRE